jgi:hypothetical protein
MKSKYRECSQTHIRDYPGCFEECDLDICEQSEKAKLAMPLVSEKEIEHHYHKPSSPWLDKPDKAGDWLRYLKHGKQYINLGIFHVDDLTEGLPTDSLWLYIEPPEPPKE